MVASLGLIPRGYLFEPSVLGGYRTDLKTTSIPSEATVQGAVDAWVTGLAAAKGATEAALEQTFNDSIFVRALGYTLYPSAGATAWPKPNSKETGITGTPDVGLGEFGSASKEFLAVVELKAPGTNLDRPQPRIPPLTPVQQAFEYAKGIAAVRWVIVSDMQDVRLYDVSDPSAYQLFQLADVAKGGQALRDFYFLLARTHLIQGGSSAPVALLAAKTAAVQADLRSGFYNAYYDIRHDLYQAIAAAPELAGKGTPPEALLEATQRLLDRLTFIYYCEDHPQQLIPAGTSRGIIAAARGLPGVDPNRIYRVLKDLFAEIDAGSPAGSGLSLPAYNGELFKPHPIVDAISLPDTLANKVYLAKVGGGTTRRIQGAWGLDIFDFWRELNEHLLGHIFEQSLSDLTTSKLSTPVFGVPAAMPSPSLADRLDERKSHGIYYTQQLLCEYMVEAVVTDVLAERTPAPVTATSPELDKHLEARMQVTESLRVVDLACGSGAFLVAAYSALANEWFQARSSMDALLGTQPELGLFADQQARLLRNTLFGADLLPQAIEISKLALWLRSARKGERVADLSTNFAACDSLDIPSLTSALSLPPAASEVFDLIIMNPPWGAETDPVVASGTASFLGLDPDHNWDTWELFLALAIRMLKPGGRLSFVLPDTFFHPEKEPTRRLLHDSAAIERLHNLGPDWFGPLVRMGTVVLQARKGSPKPGHTFRSMVLGGAKRRRVLRGDLRLSQAETQLSVPIPQGRGARHTHEEINIAVSAVDEPLIASMASAGQPLGDIASRARGEEINRGGLLWECPSCLATTVPGRKTKGGRFESKTCPQCGHRLTEANTTPKSILVTSPGSNTAPWLDGNVIAGRYPTPAATAYLRLDAKGWEYKPASAYSGPKILIRQAGVGVSATLDTTGAYVPQSVYLYRLKPAMKAAGVTTEYLLGVLLSRCMAYLITKRFAETDPARAHVKVTHARLEDLPIPMPDMGDPNQRALHDAVVAGVKALSSGSAAVGGPEDLAVEQAVRKLYGITTLGLEYINSELAKLPESQMLEELFPAGAPRPIAAPDPILSYRPD
jgi:SAM-dependent methyltransferase